MRALCLTCVMVGLLVGHYAAGSEAGPSIEEMLSAVENHESGGGAKTAGAERGSASKTRSSGRKTPSLKLTSYTTNATKRLEKRVNWTYSLLKRHGINWEIMRLFNRLERFENAAKTLAPMLKSRDPGPSEWRTRVDRLGYFELEYAQIMTYLGKEKTAESMMRKHKKMVEEAKTSRMAEEIINYGTKKYLDERREFIRGLPDALLEVEALKDALAQEPSGDIQWQLVRICDPHAEKAGLGFTWITAIFEMISRYPDDPRVTGGEAHWALQRAYRHHRMHDEALAILKSYPEDFPDSERTESRDAAWEFAYVHREKGDFLRMVRQKEEAVTSFDESLKLFRKFLKDYPKDRRCVRQKKSDGRWWSHVDSQIGHLKRRLYD